MDVGLANALRELGELHAAGALNDHEFAQARARLLAGRAPPPGYGAPSHHPDTGGHPDPAPPPWAGPSPIHGVPPTYVPDSPAVHDPARARYGHADPAGAHLPYGQGPPPDTHRGPAPHVPPPWPAPPGPRAPAGGASAGRLGSALAGVAALAVLVAFLALPLATPFPGQAVTGLDVALQAAEEPALALVWLVPAAAVATAVLGLLRVLTADGDPRARGRSLAVAGASALVLVLYLTALVLVEHNAGGEAVAVAGAGFWTAAAAAALGVVGGAAGAGRPARSGGAGAGLVAALGAVAAVLVVLLPLGDAAIPAPGPAAAPAPGPAEAAPPPATPTPQEFLDRTVAGHRAAAAQLVGYWVPQLSSKRLGLEADGIVYGYEDIERHYRSLLARYPEALLIRSDEFTSYREGGFYVVVVPRATSTPEDALAWCAGEGIGRDDCVAKLLMTTGGPEGTTRYQE